MNNSAEAVSESILGLDFKTVILAGKAYTIHPPVISTICRAIKHFSRVETEGLDTVPKVISKIPEIAPYLIRGLSEFIAGNSRFGKYKSFRLRRKLKNATSEELKTAMDACVSVIGAESFFQSAALAQFMSRMAANPKS
ncbi:hypothetical protein Barb6XT_01841 [Bacteroidales bacterium Barb6XT]|nr:hypothetical protein Barb6XT_01841 [Bacteroidales bacterium Barb6XT]